MASRKRIRVDVLGEIRRAMRILRRTERSIVQQENAVKRGQAKIAARKELESIERSKPTHEHDIRYGRV